MGQRVREEGQSRLVCLPFGPLFGCLLVSVMVHSAVSHVCLSV